MYAEFIVKDTRERVVFDYVAACGGRVFSNPHTTPTAFIAEHPQMIYQAVGDGAAMGLRTINMCESDSWQPVRGGPKRGKSRIPENLRPQAIWFDDVNDLGFGWGYISDDAYEGPRAKIEFVAASLERTDKAAWLAWREKAEAEYEQIGALPGPWGYSPSSSIEQQEFVHSLGAGTGVAAGCGGTMTHVQVSTSLVSDAIEEYTAGAKEKWVASPAYTDDFSKLWGEPSFLKGYDSLRAVRSLDVTLYDRGTLSRDHDTFVSPGSSDTSKTGLSYSDIYPMLPRSRSMGLDIDEPQEEYYRTLLFEESYKGFGACYTLGRPIDDLLDHYVPLLGDPESRPGEPEAHRPFDAAVREKRHKIKIGDEKFGNDRHWIYQRPPSVYTKDGSFFFADY